MRNIFFPHYLSGEPEFALKLARCFLSVYIVLIDNK